MTVAKSKVCGHFLKVHTAFDVLSYDAYGFFINVVHSFTSECLVTWVNYMGNELEYNTRDDLGKTS